MSNQIQIKVSDILTDLKNGLTRLEIGTKYGLNKAQVSRLFKHPKLKYKKTIKSGDPFDIVDDTEAGEVAPAEEQEQTDQMSFSQQAEAEAVNRERFLQE